MDETIEGKGDEKGVKEPGKKKSILLLPFRLVWWLVCLPFWLFGRVFSAIFGTPSWTAPRWLGFL